MTDPNLFMVIFIAILFLLFLLFQKKEPIRSNSLFDRESSDFYKGFAILIVIISHFAGRVDASRIFTPLGGIGVAFFYFFLVLDCSNLLKKKE